MNKIEVGKRYMWTNGGRGYSKTRKFYTGLVESVQPNGMAVVVDEIGQRWIIDTEHLILLKKKE